MLRHDNVIISAFTETFPFDGYNPVREKNNRLDVGGIAPLQFNINVQGVQHQMRKLVSPDDIELEAYMASPITMLTSFFGIPNRFTPSCKYISSDEPSGQSWQNIITQLLYLPEELNPSSSDIFLIGFLSAFKLTAIFIFKILPTTLMSIIKLCTEFPLTIARDFCVKHRNNPNLILRGLSNVGLVLSNFLLFTVRAITSPVKNARAAWNFEPRSKLNYLLAGISVALTIAAYIILFPIGIKFVATQALPWLAAKAPSAIAKVVTGVAKVINNISNIMNTAPTEISIGAKLGPILSPIVMNAVGINLSNGAIGTGVYLSTLLTPLSLIYCKLKNEILNDSSKRKYARVVSENIQDQLRHKTEEVNESDNDESEVEDGLMPDPIPVAPVPAPAPVIVPVSTFYRSLSTGNLKALINLPPSNYSPIFHHASIPIAIPRSQKHADSQLKRNSV